MANYVLYGLWQTKDLDPLTPASQVDRDMLIAAVEETVVSHNQEINAMLNLFCEETTEYQQQYRGGYTNFLQPGDEDQRPRPVKGKTTYTVAYALKQGMTAYGSNFVANQKMTIADFDAAVGQQLIGDVNWMRRHMLAALFTNTSNGWTFVDPIQGNLTVQGMANGDATTYAFANSEQLATDTHYARQADPIDAAHNPLPTIQSELEEHPDNAGPLISFVSTNQSSSVQALTDFVEVPTAQIANPAETDDRLTAALGVTLPRTARVIGTYKNLWIVEWGAIPNDYILTIAANGPRPLKRRQDPETGLQGFVNIGERMERFPYFRNEWIRRSGFGGWNRVGAYVQQVTTGSTTYAIPSGFNYGVLP